MMKKEFLKPLVLLTGIAIFSAGIKASPATTPNLATLSSSLPSNNGLIADNHSRNFSNSKGTLKEGSGLSIDPEEVTGGSKAEAQSRFILNKIYRVQEGTAPDDLFIVDEKATKWEVQEVSEATMGATTHSVALLVSGSMKVWAVIQKF
ncbi:MAG: hypothetical protein ACM37W_18690 [Actinomycetota bacterium]